MIDAWRFVWIFRMLFQQIGNPFRVWQRDAAITYKSEHAPPHWIGLELLELPVAVAADTLIK